MRPALLLALLAVALLPGRQAVAAEPQRAEQVQSDVSTREISIQSNFTGIEIVLFGSIDFTRAPSLDEGPYDVIMVIRGPNRPIVVRRKERIAGLWMNGASKTFPSVPGYYAVLASRPFRAVASEAVLKNLGIGFSNLDFGKTAEGETADDGFRASLIRLQAGTWPVPGVRRRDQFYRPQPVSVEASNFRSTCRSAATPRKCSCFATASC